MMQDLNRIEILLIRHLEGTLEEGDRQELDAFLETSPATRTLFHELSDDALMQQKLKDFYLVSERRPAGEMPAPVRRMGRWVRMAAAAAVVAIVATVYFWPRQEAADTARQEDVAPGTHKAILTLADGSAIALDSSDHRIIRQGIVQRGGQLFYDGRQGSASLNTLTIPRGGQYRIKLPDGTLVWLNAASSLKYPTAFTGNERKVEVTGEAYFEVAKDPRRPFRVHISQGTEVEVLGTKFNIRAYRNGEAVYTTLLEGAVRVRGVVLKPGEQAEAGQTVKLNRQVDIARVVAWKNGLFNFENASLADVMRELERWYDIDVVYENGVPDIRFGGEMSRNIRLSGVLKALEESKVKFKMQGRKLIVAQ